MSTNAKQTVKAKAAPVSSKPAPKARGAKASAAAVAQNWPSQPGGKLGLAVSLMQRAEGATINQLSEATGWLPHSVRGAMSGALKKQHKLEITSEVSPAGRVYRIGRGTPR